MLNSRSVSPGKSRPSTMDDFDESKMDGDELDWTSGNGLTAADLTSPNPFDMYVSPTQPDILTRFDPFASSSSGRIASLPMVGYVTPPRDEFRRRLYGQSMSPAVTAASKLSGHLKLVEYVSSSMKGIGKLGDEATEAETKKFFADINSNFGDLTKYRSFLFNLRSCFEGSDIMLERYEWALESESVKVLRDGSMGSVGLDYLYQSYKHSLESDSIPGAVKVCPPDFTSVYRAFVHSFLGVEESHWMDVLVEKYATEEQQQGDRSFKSFLKDGLHVNSVDWQQSKLQKIPSFVDAVIAVANMTALRRTFLVSQFPQVVPPERLVDWKLSSIEAAVTKIESSPMYKLQMSFQEKLDRDLTSTNCTTVSAVAHNPDNGTPFFASTHLERGEMRGLSSEQERQVKLQMSEAREAVRSGKLAFVPTMPDAVGVEVVCLPIEHELVTMLCAVLKMSLCFVQEGRVAERAVLWELARADGQDLGDHRGRRFI